MFYVFSEEDNLIKLKGSFPQLMQNSKSMAVNKGQKSYTKRLIYSYSLKFYK